MILRATPATGPLRGRLRPPGDKSISHRALIFSGLAEGESHITHWLDSADVRATLGAMRQLGATIEETSQGLRVTGTAGRLAAPSATLDMGNSGTAMRLLAGVLAGQPFRSTLSGDESLNARPMRRVTTPLELMGARVELGPDGTAPLIVHGTAPLTAIHYQSPVASAQIKSCVLLAGLYAEGRTSVEEPRLSRDHTERLLPLFGVGLPAPCTVTGGSRLRGAQLEVPADPSSAAFLAAAALLVPGSEVTLTDVGLNPTRTAFFKVLEAMGAELLVSQPRQVGEEPVGDVTIRYSGPLNGIDVPPEWIPAMIDEVPVLLALASTANGRTRIREAAELRVKESDRLAVMARALKAMNVEVTEFPDGIDVIGGMPQSASVDGHNDHRCAMSLAVLAQVVEGGLDISGAEYIDTSYPGFVTDMAELGALGLERVA